MTEKRKLSEDNIKLLNELFEKNNLPFSSSIGPVYCAEEYGIEGYTIKIKNVDKDEIEYHLVPGQYGDCFVLRNGDVDEEVYHYGHVDNYEREIDNGFYEYDIELFLSMENVVKTIVLEEMII